MPRSSPAVVVTTGEPGSEPETLTANMTRDGCDQRCDEDSEYGDCFAAGFHGRFHALPCAKLNFTSAHWATGATAAVSCGCDRHELLSLHRQAALHLWQPARAAGQRQRPCAAEMCWPAWRPLRPKSAWPRNLLSPIFRSRISCDEQVVPYETDEVTRLIVDTHDAEAFAPGAVVHRGRAARLAALRRGHRRTDCGALRPGSRRRWPRR